MQPVQTLVATIILRSKMQIESSNSQLPVLLYSPTNKHIQITKSKANHIERLIAGDMIEDILFVDKDFLFRYIKNRL